MRKFIFSTLCAISIGCASFAIEPNTDMPRFSVVEEMTLLDSYSNMEVNDMNVLSLLMVLGVQHPYVAMAQMKLESGNYTSSIAVNNNNYFGMRHPAQRITVSLGNRNGYARYRNWAYSVLDYALWQRKYAYNLSVEAYLTKLGNTYAQDPNYTAKIKNMARNLENKNK